MSTTAPDTRLYAIGDIHGRCDLYDRLLADIVADAHGFDGRKVLILLGDYVDRGPDSAGMLDRLLIPPPDGFERICLFGNHESMMLHYLTSAAPGPGWLLNGGVETLESYGAVEPGGRLAMARSQAKTMIPQAHLDLLRDLPYIWRNGSYIFVHAGFDFDNGLDFQDQTDLLWARPPFPGAENAQGLRVVHGHTVTDEPHIDDTRIGVDTGAWRSGVLTAVVLEGESVRFLQA